MNNYIKFFLIAIILIFSFLNFNYAFAVFLDIDSRGGIANQAEALAGTAKFDKTVTVGGIVTTVIQGFLALLGVIFVILIILGGYKWMMAEGNEEQVREAQEMIRRAIIGLIIIIAAYSITYFVFKYLPFGTGGGGFGS